MEAEERREALAAAASSVEATVDGVARDGACEGEWETIPEWILAEGRAAEEERARRDDEGAQAGRADQSEEKVVEKAEDATPKPKLPPSAPIPERSGLCVICCDRSVSLHLLPLIDQSTDTLPPLVFVEMPSSPTSTAATSPYVQSAQTSSWPGIASTLR